MPDDLRQREGHLLGVLGGRRRGNERIDCPEEADYFRALGVETVPAPAARTGARALEYAGAERRNPDLRSIASRARR